MKHLSILLLSIFILQSCVQDDIIADRQDEKLTFNNSISRLTIKGSHQLETKFTNNVGKVTTPTITWMSSDENILTVSNSGLLNAVAIGRATITASVKVNEQTTVTQSQEIEVLPETERIDILNVIEEIVTNNTHQYQTNFINRLGNSENVTITWSSSNTSILTVSSTGLITAISQGNATITASTMRNGQQVTAQDQITVTPIAERFSINNPITELNVNGTHQYTTTYTNPSGTVTNRQVTWSSSNSAIISVTNAGKITAVSGGEATITASVTNATGGTLSVDNKVTVKSNSPKERTGTIRTTSSYVLQGTFTLREIPNTNDLELVVNSDYRASSSLPGLYIYLSNNPSTNNNAKELQAVQVFSGAHRYVIPNTGINDFSHVLYWCKPFRVKVGDAVIN